MKKKILILGIIAILIAMVCFLTGCGSQEENTDNSVDNSVANNQVTTSKENLEKVAVSEMYAYSKNYAIVKGSDNKIYIIDKDGISQGTLPVAVNGKYTINDNGYITVSISGTLSTYNVKGEKLLQSSGNEVYYDGITNENYMIKRTTVSDFNSGSSYKYEVVDMEGNTIHEIEYTGSSTPQYVGGNLYLLGSSYVYNAKTNQKASFDVSGSRVDDYDFVMMNDDFAVSDNWGINVMMTVIKEDLSVIEKKNLRIKPIDSNYYYDRDQNAIYTYDGDLFKTITEGGGISSINYDGNQYQIISSTGYYYTANENFEKTSEPILIGGIRGCYATEYGIVALKEASDYALYDYEGNLIADFGKCYLRSVYGFLGLTDSLPMNLKTAEIITIYK